MKKQKRLSFNSKEMREDQTNDNIKKPKKLKNNNIEKYKKIL